VLIPNIAAAKINIRKLDFIKANAAINTAATADNDDIEEPYFLPIFFISIVAGIVDNAVTTTIRDTGKVAKDWFSVKDEPIIPPSVTIVI
jgi:hypothetical protein